MAADMADKAFAAECRAIADTGRQSMVTRLFNGEYFINLIDPHHLEALNSGSGCEIDQVFGQSWAFQVGLGRVLPQKETRAALQSLWRYNFSPDLGPYRAVYKGGRWFALAGEAGLLMCTFPRKDWSFANAIGKGNTDGCANLFNECMNGFEYQAAGHMIWEGMLTEGLAVTRAVHDRYHPSRRNPWNEVECGDHYARSMASYGVFLAACGYEHHAPRGHVGFAPRLTPDDFRAAFTSAEGWGTFAQKREGQAQKETIAVKSGKIRVRTLAFAVPENAKVAGLTVRAAGKDAPARHVVGKGRLDITLEADAAVEAGQALEVSITMA
jgi:hypothetical protein